tara:strand:+ start:2281 stop:2661 length:381 start_codon:yes stop_codon:yes gene_type:complete
MSFDSKLLQLVNEERERSLVIEINKHNVNISKKHQISLESLTRSIPDTCAPGICRGIMHDLTRCTYKVVDEDSKYCNVHKEQGEVLPYPQIVRRSGIEHNHDDPDLRNVPGCPACEKMAYRFEYFV